jgi:hypothetical protein
MRRTTIALFAFALLGCSDGSGPDPREQFAGTWALVSIDGQPVPVEMLAGPPTTVELTSIELDFPNATDPGVETRTFLSTPTAGGAPATTTGTTEIAFEVNGNQVTIINTESGLPDDVGTLSGDELTISRSVFGTYRTHVYQKQP